MSAYRSYHHSIGQTAFVDHKRSPRIVPLRGENREIRYQKMEQWMAKHYPHNQTIQTAKIKENNRFYTRRTFRTVDGRIEVVFFDITEDTRREMHTYTRMFPGGTMIHVWPRQGSVPTRIEYFK
ncbi:unnamed protein product [Adineta ricciae]|uniref:Uncharacterized protein n=1 Tax=Adineta ricciae TaxID=249248 RepID=A0A814UMC0_ADIRI|nr:unnamed protein product [Adineta ricciae]